MFIYGSFEYGLWTIRLGAYCCQLKAPWNTALFSERYGYKKFWQITAGWRIRIGHV